MADIAEYVDKALYAGNYTEVFDMLYDIFTDEDYYREERSLVFRVISYMKRMGFDQENISKRLEYLFEECSEFGIVTKEFKNTVYGYLIGTVW